MTKEQEDKIIAQAQDILERRLGVNPELKVNFQNVVYYGAYLLGAQMAVEKLIPYVMQNYRGDDNVYINKLRSAVSHDLNDFNIKFIDTCKRQDGVYNDSSILFWLEADTMDRAIKVAKERYFAIKSNEYIWMRLARPCNDSLWDKYERFNIRTNEFIKPDTL